MDRRLRLRPGQGRLRLPAVPPEQADLDQVRRLRFPAVALVKNFNWTNEDQNTVSSYIGQDGMSPDDAAQKWIDANPDKVNAWLQGTGAS